MKGSNVENGVVVYRRPRKNGPKLVKPEEPKRRRRKDHSNQPNISPVHQSVRYDSDNIHKEEVVNDHLRDGPNDLSPIKNEFEVQCQDQNFLMSELTDPSTFQEPFHQQPSQEYYGDPYYNSDTNVIEGSKSLDSGDGDNSSLYFSKKARQIEFKFKC